MMRGDNAARFSSGWKLAAALGRPGDVRRQLQETTRVLRAINPGSGY